MANVYYEVLNPEFQRRGETGQCEAVYASQPCPLEAYAQRRRALMFAYGNLHVETNETCGRKIMRRFVVQFVTGIDFVDGDEASDDVVQNYKRHLAETVQDATQNLALRTIKGVRVEKVQVEEIKTEGI